MVLGCILTQPDLLFQPQYPLSKFDFEVNIFHKTLFICIVQVAKSGAKDISEFEIENFVKNYPAQFEILQDNNFFDFISTVKELSAIENYDVYYNVVRKFGLLRDLQRQGYDISKYFNINGDETEERAKLDNYSIQDVLNDIDLKTLKLRNKFDVKYVRDEMDAGEDTEGLLELFEETPAFGSMLQSPYLTTLFQGWCRGHLLLRSAPSGVGKTRLAIADLCTVGATQIWDETSQDFVDNLNYQGPSFFIHTEMNNREEVNPMFLAAISGVEYRLITNGLYTKDQRNRILKAGDILLNSHIKISDMPDFTNKSIERKIKEQVEGRGAAYGIFDYVQLQGAIAAEYKETTNMPIREDLVLKAVVTELKGMAEKYNVGLYSMTQVNDNWKQSDFPDESCLSGGRSQKNKIDAGSIVLPTKERNKEFKRIAPYLSKRGIGNAKPFPNIIEYIYKSRFGSYGDQKIKIWSYFDKGTFKRQDYFCTDAYDNFVNVSKSVLKTEEE